MEECIFCKIVKEEIPADKVYEDDYVLAFKDINPATPIHVLIIPKKHIKNLMELKPEDNQIMIKIVEAIQKIAKLVGVEEDGFRLISNCGPHSGQEVMHLHFHLLAGKQMGPKIV